MASKKQRQEATKKRDKRSKLMLIVLGVLLVAVGAYEIPSMLAVMNKKPPPGTTYDPGPSSVAPGSLPNIATGAPVATSAAAAPKPGELVNTDLPPTSADGQLVTFEVFDTKNPFRPQVTSSPDVAPGSVVPSTTANHTPTSTAPTTTTAVPSPSSTRGAIPSAGVASAPIPTTPTTPAAPAAPTVTISVNNVATNVAKLGTFPAGSPVFRLISYQQGTAEIGIVGGSYAAGGQTITLQVGHPITLENTTDRTRYRLELLKTP